MFALRASLAAAALCLSAAASTASPAMPDTRPVARASRLASLPAHWQHGAFMEIFVRAYADSDGDGIGDLRGLTSRLDHLKDLGVRGIWLMPITASADHDHGYATTDHRALEPAYGSLADLDELLRQARRRGIGVIIDYVVNHAASDHAFFVDARTNPRSRWRDWFVWSDSLPTGWDIWGKNPWYAASTEPWAFRGDQRLVQTPATDPLGYYFGVFGPAMPDFNLRNPEVLNYHLDSLRWWLNRGLAGFRLDAMTHLVENDAQHWNDQPESRAMTRHLQALITNHPGRMAVCEATAEPQAWADRSVCGGAFGFDLAAHVTGAARGLPAAVQRLADYFHRAPHTVASFVSNHDLFAGRRLWDQLNGDEQRYKLAAAGYLLLPGTPFIYYGEEVGQAQLRGLPGDQPLRGPMSWTADPQGAGFTRGTPFRPVAPNALTHNVEHQRKDPGSILNFYRAMLALRNTRPSIKRGSYEASFADDRVLSFQRVLGRERTLVVINYGDQPATVTLPGVKPGQAARPLYPRGPVAPFSAMQTVPALSVRVLDLR